LCRNHQTNPYSGSFYENHAWEIEQYEASLTYLKDNLNGHGKIPEKDWRAQRESLLAERYAHCDEYYKLREDIKSVETLRRGADNLMRDITPERTQARKLELDL